MSGSFDSAGLKAELERALGFRMSGFKRLKCVNSVNFRVTRESDGFVFLVKGLPAWRRAGYDMIVRHVRELKGTLAPQRLFEAECPASFGGYDLICLTWCEGESLFPDRLSEDELDAFLDAYLSFSDALQRTSVHHFAYPGDRWRQEALEKCRTGWGRLVRPCVEDCAAELSFFRPECQRVQHGDLHPGNFVFANGRVVGFLDVEGLTKGYCAWDLVRYFVFSLDRLSVFARRRRAKTFAHFARAVRRLPYPREEWITSLNVSWLEQIHKKLEGPRVGLVAALQLRLHSRLYRKLRAMAVENA